MKKIPNEKTLNGGHARAAKLTSTERSDIARKAAAARWDSDVPKAKYFGVIRVAGHDLPCAVLEVDGAPIRLIVQREVVGLLTLNKKGGLGRYLNATNLQPYVPQKFRGKSNSLAEVTRVVEINGRKCQCYEGEDIVDILQMYINARSSNALLESQIRLADRAQILISAFAKTGVSGVIDEATGYQEVRMRDALQLFLSKVIREELAAWVERFPSEFFAEIYRLRGWSYNGNSKRPQVIGKYIREFVYRRLAPGVIEELEKKNPKNESGNRRARHHQWLTEDIGNPALDKHLVSMISLMKISDSWSEFKSHMDKVHPVRHTLQPSLF